MADLWMPGATRVPGNNGLLAGAGGGRGLRFHTWHTFEAPYSFSPDCVAAARYLNSQGSTATFCFHPVTGAITQLLPANVAARTLRAQAGYPTDVNRYGSVHMQTEVIAYARRPFTLDLTEAGRRGLERLVNFLRAWGVPDQWAWAYGPPAYPGGSVQRVLPVRSGHAFHAGWPVNDHLDPGAIAAPWTYATPPVSEPAVPAPPAVETSPDVKTLQGHLMRLGYDLAPYGADGRRGVDTEAAIKSYVADYGHTGPTTTAALLTATEDTVTTLADLAKTVADLPRRILAAPFPASALTRANAAIPDNLTVGGALDHTLRRAQGAWTYAHNARTLAGANADRLKGLEQAVQELAANVPGVDTEAVTAAIEAAVGRYELTLSKIDTEEN